MEFSQILKNLQRALDSIEERVAKATDKNDDRKCVILARSHAAALVKEARISSCSRRVEEAAFAARALHGTDIGQCDPDTTRTAVGLVRFPIPSTMD